jgi:hypothetical protein
LALRDSPAPGHLSVIVVPGLSGLSGQGTAPSSSELNAIRQALDAARPITTRVHVVGPTYIPFGVRLTLVKTRQASADLVNTAAINQLADFFDPLRGGHDEKGWPFGRSVYVSEVYQLLGKIPGVDYVTRSLDANGEDMEELFVDPLYSDRRCLNDAGELESIEVHDEELVALKIDPADVIVLEKASRRL